MLVMMGLAAAVQPSGSDLQREIEALEVVGSVLYVAAHPDDENTRLLAYLVGERHLDVTYLSLTRGGGGQNLVGDQMAELLGVVRTGELLAARSIDGAGQRFTRARDFGYSKSADETLSSWGHDEVLDDVVRVIRELQPDVVITRFGPDDETHGHHVASAILAAEAVEKAADPSYATPGSAPWTVDRVLRNESHWRIKDDTDTSGWLTVDVGGYDAARGVSWGEVAAASRTMHKSQGFGSAPSVGKQLEYFSAVSGAVPEVGQDLLQGLDTSWSRIEGSKPVVKALKKLRFDPGHPAGAIPGLVRVKTALAGLPEGPWRDRKAEAVDGLILEAAGVWVTAFTDQAAVAPGGELTVELEVVVRGANAKLLGAKLGSAAASATTLKRNELLEAELVTTLADDEPFTKPYWLASPPSETLYTLDGEMRTLPEQAPSMVVEVDLEIAGTRIQVEQPVEHAWTDRVHGQLRHPLEILPPVTASFDHRVRMTPANTPFTLPLTLRGDGAERSGTLTLLAPEGGAVSPTELSFSLDAERREQLVEVTVTPGAARGVVGVEVDVEGQKSAFAKDVIDLPHLARRTVLRPASLVVVPVALERGEPGRIAYLEGSGDEIARTLHDLGYAVTPLDEDGITQGALDELDTVVLGIRAFNTRPRLGELKGALLDWVAEGGRLIVQYNTSSSRSPLDDLGPAPLVIRRDRVTDQTAPMVAIDPKSAVLNKPNALAAGDYEGWVQERGLYFAESWDSIYQPVFRMHDPGEEPLEGALLVAKHGKGTFVYTGMSFFRQFPAGVPGAARLFANLLAVEAP